MEFQMLEHNWAWRDKTESDYTSKRLPKAAWCSCLFFYPAPINYWYPGKKEQSPKFTIPSFSFCVRRGTTICSPNLIANIRGIPFVPETIINTDVGKDRFPATRVRKIGTPLAEPARTLRIWHLSNIRKKWREQLKFVAAFRWFPIFPLRLMNTVSNKGT